MECVFCENENGRILRIADHELERTVLENEDWIVYPTLGAYVIGYVLVVLKRHKTCTASCENNELMSLLVILSRIAQIFKKAHSTTSVFVFEHGALKKSRQLACCINHAHIHIFPSHTDIYSAVVNQIPSHIEEFPELDKCYEWIKNRRIDSYLLFGSITLSKYCVVDTSIDVYPSQYLRQLTYRLLVSDQTRRGWDWRQYPYYQNMLETIAMFRENS